MKKPPCFGRNRAVFTFSEEFKKVYLFALYTEEHLSSYYKYHTVSVKTYFKNKLKISQICIFNF